MKNKIEINYPESCWGCQVIPRFGDSPGIECSYVKDNVADQCPCSTCLVKMTCAPVIICEAVKKFEDDINDMKTKKNIKKVRIG